MTPQGDDDTVLVIRMWREPGMPLDGTDWRGRVDLLPDGERRSFVGLQSLLGILTERLNAAPVDRAVLKTATAQPAPRKSLLPCAATPSTEIEDGS